MPLPTSDDVRQYLKIEPETWAVEQALIDRLVTQATAVIESHLGVPFTTGRTFAPASSETTGWATVQSVRSGNSAARASVRSISVRPLSEYPDWATRVEPIVFGAIMDFVADLYHRRNPSVAAESEAGVSVQYMSESVVTPVGLPPRLVGVLRPIKNEIKRWLAS